MKSKLLLIFLLVSQIQAGAQYQVSVTKAAYADLSGGSNLTYFAQDSGYYFNTSLLFKTFNQHYANFNLQSANPVSAGGFMDKRGMLVTYDTIGSNNVVVFQCFENTRFESMPGITTAATKIEGAAGSRIVKFQWKNLVYNKVNTQTANFQIWLHEADGSISYHYGPNTLPPATTAFDGGYTGIVVVKGDGSILMDEINLEGKPGTPAIYRNITTSGLPTLDSIPPNGTVYTFKRTPAAVTTIAAGNMSLIYPNPATNTLFFKGTNLAGSIVSVYNRAGQLVDQPVVSNQNSIEVSHLPSGTYAIWWNTQGKSASLRFVKQ